MRKFGVSCSCFIVQLILTLFICQFYASAGQLIDSEQSPEMNKVVKGLARKRAKSEVLKELVEQSQARVRNKKDRLWSIYRPTVSGYDPGYDEWLKQDQRKLEMEEKESYQRFLETHQPGICQAEHATGSPLLHSNLLADLKSIFADPFPHPNDHLIELMKREFCRHEGVKSVMDARLNKSEIEKWKNVNTDPAHHDPQHFQYIVHALKYHNGENLNEFIQDPNSSFRDRLFSTSIINQDKNRTYMQGCGFILDVPPDNIVATYHEDMGSQARGNVSPLELCEEIFNQNYQYPIRSPKLILEKTQLPHSESEPYEKYNEVLVYGKNIKSNTNVKVIGVFLRKSDKGEIDCITQENKEVLEEIAKLHKLPTVFLPNDNK